MVLELLPLLSGDLLPTSLSPTISSAVAEFLRLFLSARAGVGVTV